MLRAESAGTGGAGEVMGGAVNIYPLLSGTRVVKIKADEMGNARRTHWNV
jgi:hypothetical protein